MDHGFGGLGVAGTEVSFGAIVPEEDLGAIVPEEFYGYGDQVDVLAGVSGHGGAVSQGGGLLGMTAQSPPALSEPPELEVLADWGPPVQVLGEPLPVVSRTGLLSHLDSADRLGLGLLALAAAGAGAAWLASRSRRAPTSTAGVPAASDDAEDAGPGPHEADTGWPGVGDGGDTPAVEVAPPEVGGDALPAAPTLREAGSGRAPAPSSPPGADGECS